MFGEIWSVIVGRIFALHVKFTDFLHNYYKLPEFSKEPNAARIIFSFSTVLDVKHNVNGMVLEMRRDGHSVSGPY